MMWVLRSDMGLAQAPLPKIGDGRETVPCPHDWNASNGGFSTAKPFHSGCTDGPFPGSAADCWRYPRPAQQSAPTCHSQFGISILSVARGVTLLGPSQRPSGARGRAH